MDTLTPQYDVSVTKVDNKGGSSITPSVGTVVPGTSFTYTVVVSNNGPSTATSVLVSDILPAAITSDTWSGSDGSSGAGPINDTIGSLAVGGTVTYTVIASVEPVCDDFWYAVEIRDVVTVSTPNDTKLVEQQHGDGHGHRCDAAGRRGRDEG